MVPRDETAELHVVVDERAAHLALAEGDVIDLPDLPDPPRPCETEQSLEAVLDACNWNMARAARRLGVNRSTVLRRIRKEGLRAPG